MRSFFARVGVHVALMKRILCQHFVQGETALCIAAFYGLKDIVVTLLEHDADPLQTCIAQQTGRLRKRFVSVCFSYVLYDVKSKNVCALSCHDY